MGITLNYALVFAAVQVVFSLVLFFLGFETDKIAQLQNMSYIGLVFSAAVLWLGIKATREAAPDKSLAYGRGVGVGTLISLYGGVLTGLYRFFHLKFINPNFIDYEMDLIRHKWVAAGMSDAQMEQAEKVTRMMMGPGISAILTPIFSVIIGLILSLIIAAILKRVASVAVEPPVVQA
ncbi:MAG: DUF4199 domain-containing protein [Opitutales bacterium]